MAYQHPQQPQPFQAYGYCESYFVENHDDDDGMFARAAAERERARGAAKLRQKAFAEELSRATAEEYQEDILDHMEHMEVGHHRRRSFCYKLIVIGRNDARHPVH